MKEILHFYYKAIGLSKHLLLLLLLVSQNTLAADKTSSLNGVISTVGSDTLSRLISQWSEAFQQQHPQILLELHTGGSSSAATALISGTTLLAPMSRRMSSQESRQFQANHGYNVTEVPLAEDRIAVFVHPDNPLSHLTLTQLDAIFSSTRLRGHPTALSHWNQLQDSAAWSNRHIAVFSRSVTSGTYGDFRELALAGGDFINRLIELPGSIAVVRGVAATENAIGYASVAYRDPSIKLLSLQVQTSSPLSHPLDTLTDYPLARTLYLYINQPPDTPLPAHYHAWLRFIFSAEGQAILQASGLRPLPVNQYETQLQIFEAAAS
ncbi:PstS family phosphate ABC transporter substrate-binding protein [Nitrincola sp.]|uniref:PstS family phosphate ABC transporter substrate-binding protein n=1 Tax=Nitrincola sp. TaxID=1926584 RepID=UPI003A93C224